VQQISEDEGINESVKHSTSLENEQEKCGTEEIKVQKNTWNRNSK
jgi:hypothetical protein